MISWKSFNFGDNLQLSCLPELVLALLLKQATIRWTRRWSLSWTELMVQSNLRKVIQHLFKFSFALLEMFLKRLIFEELMNQAYLKR
jgi:hypothetical protein